MINITTRATELLKESYGDNSAFRDGQLEAIQAIMKKEKTLVIQKTGWGKSIVYFIATKLLREQGAGPAIIISPLLALMHNQIEAAAKLGLNVVTINSNNRDEWDEIYANLQQTDAVIVSPEKLSSPDFIEALTNLRDIELIVVDEAHSISDWGHDFRPDYQRIVRLLKTLPDSIAVLGTTATANDRVIEDIKAQFGHDLNVFRGDLMRHNISIQVNRVQSKAERLAFVTDALTHHPFLSAQQGIIYCLTKRECEDVTTFLQQHDISCEAYYSGVQNELGESIEQEVLERFHTGQKRVIVATVKLGMGYDKANIGFVIHYQLPQNLISYYQQIGRAGRNGAPALAILLHGDEDEEIIKSFIDSAYKDPSLLSDILKLIANYPKGLSRNEILQHFNLNVTKLSSVLKYLFVHEYIYMDKRKYVINPNETFDERANKKLQQQLNDTRIAELDNLKQFVNYDGCYMQYIANELDAPDLKEKCGICTHCKGRTFIPMREDNPYLEQATAYKNKLHGVIEPRKRHANNKKLDEALRYMPGWTYTTDPYSPIGKRFMAERANQHYSEKTMITISNFLAEHIQTFQIDTIVPVPNKRYPSLVNELTQYIAREHGLNYVEALDKTRPGYMQSEMHNSIMQEQNITDTLALKSTVDLTNKNILLIDSIVNSRWTMTVAASLLLQQANAVYPFALVNVGG